MGERVFHESKLMSYDVIRDIHGSLVACRWDGEPELGAEKFVAVEHVEP